VVLGGLSRNQAAAHFKVSERSALGEAVPNHGRNFAGALWRRPTPRPDRGASRLSVGPDPAQPGHDAARDPGAADRQLRRALFGLCAVAFLRPSRTVTTKR
jgi:hypothetical protein